jgi:hypothetical protein
MSLFVPGVVQKQRTQQGVGGQFGSADKIAPALCLGFGESEQIARPPRRVEPYPTMDRPQQYLPNFHQKIGNI